MECEGCRSTCECVQFTCPDILWSNLHAKGGKCAAMVVHWCGKRLGAVFHVGKTPSGTTKRSRDRVPKNRHGWLLCPNLLYTQLQRSSRLQRSEGSSHKQRKNPQPRRPSKWEHASVQNQWGQTLVTTSACAPNTWEFRDPSVPSSGTCPVLSCLAFALKSTDCGDCLPWTDRLGTRVLGR